MMNLSNHCNAKINQHDRMSYNLCYCGHGGIGHAQSEATQYVDCVLAQPRFQQSFFSHMTFSH